MFKASHNRAILGLEIATVTPLSIRAGDIGLDPSASDLVCIRTRHAERGRTVFVPGSGLKGVVRSSAEALLRSVRGALACEAGEECGKLRCETSAEFHRHACRACRLFGSTTMKGRCSVRDMFPFREPQGELPEAERDNLARANRTEVRPGIAISRISGAVAGGALFDQEMVPAGVTFWGDIALENYQVWQLGLLMSAIDELDAGFAQLGSGKSKGLGVVRATVTSILHEQRAGAARPCGVGRLVAKEEAERYGLALEADLPASQPVRRGLVDRFAVHEASIGAWRDDALKALELLDEVGP